MIYWDMDTFLLRDPTPRFKAAAEGYDALFARHGDGDCVNIGVFYIKAGAVQGATGDRVRLEVSYNTQSIPELQLLVLRNKVSMASVELRA